MKLILKCSQTFFLLILLTSFSNGQSPADTSMVLQKCIDLPELQAYYPVKASGENEAVYVMQYPISFSSDLEVSKFGRNVMFITQSEITEKEIKAHFRFRNFEITRNSARVNLNYFYDHDFSTNQFKMISASLQLQKSGEIWNVTAIDLKGGAR